MNTIRIKEIDFTGRQTSKKSQERIKRILLQASKRERTKSPDEAFARLRFHRRKRHHTNDLSNAVMRLFYTGKLSDNELDQIIELKNM